MFELEYEIYDEAIRDEINKLIEIANQIEISNGSIRTWYTKYKDVFRTPMASRIDSFEFSAANKRNQELQKKKREIEKDLDLMTDGKYSQSELKVTLDKKSGWWYENI